LLDEGHCLRAQALSICSAMGAEESAYRATSLETLREMVAGGSGLTLMPALAVPEGASCTIRYFPITGRPFFRTIGLCYRASDTRTTLYQALVNHIRASVRGLRHLRPVPSR
jgi:LysR family hydrogen peroxide-inducible transcriptional activator